MQYSFYDIMELPDLANIAKFRKKLNWTQKKLAGITGISQSMIAKIESGKKKPSFETAQSIFKILSQSINKQIKNSENSAKKFATFPIVTLKPKDIVRNAIKKMGGQYDQIPVVEDGACVGSVTSKLLLQSSLNENRELYLNRPIREIMEDALPTIDENSHLSSVYHILQIFPAVLTVGRGKISGIITRSDLIAKM